MSFKSPSVLALFSSQYLSLYPLLAKGINSQVPHVAALRPLSEVDYAAVFKYVELHKITV